MRRERERMAAAKRIEALDRPKAVPRAIIMKLNAETVAILRALVKRYRTGSTAPSPAPVATPVRPAKPIKVKP